ncbi:hypothetical protein Y032_0147g2567 [Ancylostoma ceylanicum]|uniref:Uncharacterized protein n=1 Tax=Ancylostoma ceylanicum TaxID=53326 RepID=A0A016T249_9BILA|nr:hypothetical protein Y032_0147g2567 [Ancylostoma ceylanicum]
MRGVVINCRVSTVTGILTHHRLRRYFLSLTSLSITSTYLDYTPDAGGELIRLATSDAVRIYHQVIMRLHGLLLLCCLILCSEVVRAQFGWRCGYVGGWCGNERWRSREPSGGFRSKARLMAALARSVGENLAV